MPNQLISIIVFTAFTLWASSSYSQEKSCPEIAKEYLQDFSKLIWEPSFNRGCQEEKVRPECKDYVNRLRTNKKDWRSYLGECEFETGQEIVMYPLSCTNIIEEIITELSSNFAIQMIDDQKNEECSKSSENRLLLISQFNQKVPKLLRIRDNNLKANLQQRDCREISAFLTRHFKNRVGLLTQRIPFYAERLGLNEDEKEFLNWKKALAEPFLPEDSLSQKIKSFLKQEVSEFSCMTNYRRTELACKVVIQVLAMKDLKLFRTRIVRDFDEKSIFPTYTIDEPEFAQKIPLARSGTRRQLIEKIDKIEAQMKKSYYNQVVKELPIGTEVNIGTKAGGIQARVDYIDSDGILVQNLATKEKIKIPFDSGYEVVSPKSKVPVKSPATNNDSVLYPTGKEPSGL